MKVLTPAQISKIQAEKGPTQFSVKYITSFEIEWIKVVERLKRSKADLSKINIGIKLEKNGGVK